MRKSDRFSFLSKEVFLVLIPILLALVVYWPSLNYDFCSLDDDTLITKNELVTQFGFDKIHALFSRAQMGHHAPLTTFSYIVNYNINNQDAFGFRLVNLLIHLINIALMYQLLLKLSHSSYLSFLGACIMAIHPYNIESVIWISSRGNLLWTLFYLLASIQYLNYLALDKKNLLLKVFLFFILALLCKSAAITFPLFALLLLWYTKGRFTIKKHHIFLFLLSIFFGLWAIHGAKHLGTLALDNTITGLDRIWIGFAALFQYLKGIVWPMGQSPLHPIPYIHTGLPITYKYMALGFAGIFVLIIWLAKPKKNILFFWAIFLLHFAAVSQFISIGNVFIAERYTYFPYPFFVLLLNPVLKASTQKSTLNFALGTLYIALMVFLNIQYQPVWKNGKTVYQKMIQQYPKHAYGYYGLGLYCIEKQELTNAISHFKKAVELNPSFPLAELNLANAYKINGQYNESKTHYARALILKPLFPEANYGMALIYKAEGHRDSTHFFLQKSIDQNLQSPIAYLLMASIFEEQSMHNKALETYQNCLEKYPTYVPALKNMGSFFFRAQQYANALNLYQKGLELSPNDAELLDNTAKTYYMLGNKTMACESWNKILVLNPETKQIVMDICNNQ